MALGVALVTLWAGAGCSRAVSSGARSTAPAIEVVQVEQRDVPVQREWIGTIDGKTNAAIRAQVAGYLLSQHYVEGSFVQKGQLLFIIDPRPFQAAVEQARAQLARATGQLAQAEAQLKQAVAEAMAAEAGRRRTQLDADRYVPLAKQKAVTQQDADNAVNNNVIAQAQAEAARAAVETARAQTVAAKAAEAAARAELESTEMNLGFTRLTSPIDGIAGQASIQVGNLVGPTTAPVTTVSTLDPVKVCFSVSEQEYLALIRQEAGMRRMPLTLVLADGTTHRRPGTLLFVDREVKPTTGAIHLTALFPNPGNVLRPGQYAKVVATVATRKGALLVPQRAVTELQGSYQVAVVDNSNTVVLRTVKASGHEGAMWVIEEGLHAGERVVAEGLQKVAPGMKVAPRPFTRAAM